MAPSKTRTIKNKNAGPKKTDDDKPKSSKSSAGRKGPVNATQLKEKNRALLLKKPKRKTYTDTELNIPKLNMITPVGVVKPKGKKKGKVFVDDKEAMTTIMSLVQAEKEGQIESKITKARQLEEIRQARKEEAAKKEEERKTKLENVKESLRKKRKRGPTDKDDDNIKGAASAGTKMGKPSKRKSVSFA
ncbi:60S ribosomal subunit assembly/export protein loc-like protein [Emericellopsis cladophorae]|uniref:60S ribosomal subunit assembly/export protein loc-like protein n=1 Tax=Emericellopsis cladophorae TaxID=2686198 RepID=A0A9Q0BEK4_9HYPO|nr:60S ribosomal subunit assembly/export protein loc-like protein [Emericellopsis cladophorae]KAI6783017.1 60S ribosomal subunit assembly/export protein loc-like protein [Emericellopsis cladophorae]